MSERDDGTPRTLETVGRACDVIEVLDELGGAGVTDVAERTNVSKSSAHAYLATLREKQLVVKDGDTYRLSLQFLYLGESVRHRNALFVHGEEQVDRLAEETGEYAHLMCEQHGLERNIYKAAGENAVGDEYHLAKQQTVDYLHPTSTGKAVLAHLPDERVREIIDRHRLPERTENTITDPERLFERLATIRERGYAVNDEEEVKQVRAVGAPILDSDNEVLGAISVSGPTSRLQGERFRETIPALVTEAANVIAADINMSSVSRTL